MENNVNEFKYNFLGGELCLDFCNTFDHLHTPPEYDYFTDSTAIMHWAVAAGIMVTDKEKARLANEIYYDKLLRTRHMVFELLFPFIDSRLPPKSSLVEFNELLQEKNRKTQIALNKKGGSLIFISDDPLEQIEYEVVRSTANLLLSISSVSLKQCEGCGWLFRDQSRTHARRWCSMEICGNRAKASRHYARSRQ